MIFVGPSGCGKTTALRMVAGLEHPTSGEILIGGKVVNDLDPVDRDIAMVFQNYALYPHMTVRNNIGFPLACRTSPRTSGSGGSRAPPTCSASASCSSASRARSRAASGSASRWVARSSAIRTAFLMDEPLSNLDAKLRVQMRAELVKLHQRLGVTTLYVTHDQTEAMTLGERVAVLNHGVIQQVDTPGRALQPPGQHVRGDVHRQPGDELPARAALRRRGRVRRVPVRAPGRARGPACARWTARCCSAFVPSTSSIPASAGRSSRQPAARHGRAHRAARLRDTPLLPRRRRRGGAGERGRGGARRGARRAARPAHARRAGGAARRSASTSSARTSSTRWTERR